MPQHIRPHYLTSLLLGFSTLLFTPPVRSLGDSDTVTWGGDNTRAGYQPKHNLDPSVVSSPDFGQIFRTALPGNFNGLAAEQIFSSPLVYTGNDGAQYVYVATTQNNVYKIDAKTGAIVLSRNLHVPFLQAELESCVDINPLIGITATGVIDPETGIWYVTAKTYSDKFQDGKFSPQKPPGRLNGRIWQHAIHTEDLSEASGWPVLVDGTVFRNNPNRMFIGGNQHSRPGALLVGDYVYTGYASHCVQYNITGAIIGFHKKTGQIVEAFATEGGPEPNTVKGGGVWMSGGGMAYDGRGSMYFTTGNGYASQLKNTGNSVPGRNPPTALEEAAVNAKINDDGTITVIDFFMPWEKVALDGADRDLGTTPLQLLPSDVFSCPNNKRIGVVTGKSGKTYWLDLDNLGGYQMGPNKQDAVIQTYQNENSVYAAAGVLPLSGGYIYISVTQYPTHVFKFACNSAGNAVFTKIADTPDNNAYILGTGHGTVTSLNDRQGSALLWTSDVQGLGLRVYDPIPQPGSNTLNLLKTFDVPGVTKFSRPVFGNGRVYVSTNQGYLYGFGSPVNPPLNCSSPYDFGSVALNDVSSPVQIICTALTDTTVNQITIKNAQNFNISSLSKLPFNLAMGKSFTLSAVCTPSNVGSLSTDIDVNLANTRSGFSSYVPITLKATGRSAKPFLAIAPSEMDFLAIAGTSSQMLSSLFWNLGDSLLTFENISFSPFTSEGPWVQPNVTGEGALQVGSFVFVYLPTTIPPGGSAPINVFYNPDTSGDHGLYVTGFSNGGETTLEVNGHAGTQPKCIIEFQSFDGSGWVPYTPGTPFDFGTVLEAQMRNLLLRISNGGDEDAVPLSITISKAPYGIPGIIGKSNNIDLAEGTSLQVGQGQTANLYCSAPKSQVNTPSYSQTAVWVINSDDPDLGKQQVQFSCTASSEQVGPLFSNGSAQYGYVGCFKENNPGRQLAVNVYSDTNGNTNDRCINTCYSQGFIFAGTQYSQECWCGNAIPIQKDTDADCNFGCTGNKNQTCGGDGYLHDTAHMSLFADLTKFDGNTNSPPLQITPNVGQYNFVGCYLDVLGRTLNDKATSSNVMTVQACAAFCSSYSYFGLEFAAECYCGTLLNLLSVFIPASQCNMPCKGSNSQYCGAGSRMQIYQANGKPLLPLTVSSPSPSRSTSSAVSTSLTLSTTKSSTSSILTSYTSKTLSSSSASTSSSTSSSATPTPSGPLAGWSSAGCYTEAPDRRALGDKQIQGVSANTLEYCANFCSGYAYFGVEYGSECYCGKTIYQLSVKQPDSKGCNMACPGNSAQNCGGPNFLNVYTFSSSSSSAPPSSSTSRSTAQPPVSTSLTSLSKSSSTSQASSSTTSSSSSSTLSSGSSSSSSSTSTSSAAAPTPTGPISCPSSDSTSYTAPNGAVYRIDCFTDRQGFDLSVAFAATLEQCLASCGATNGCKVVVWIATTSGTSPCYIKSGVGNKVTDQRIWGAALISGPPSSISSSTSTPTSSSVVVVTVSSSATVTLTPIAPSSIPKSSTSTVSPSAPPLSSSPTTSASSTSTSTSTSTTTTTTTSTSSSSYIAIATFPAVGSYKYAGCWSDPASLGRGRALSAVPALRNSNSMTPTLCADYCKSFATFGVEYGSECWCGPHPSANSTLVPTQSDCNMACAGDRTLTCGSAGRLSLYRSDDPRKASADPAVPGPRVGNYSYVGCWVDTARPRLLSGVLSGDGMSTGACVAAAEAAGQLLYAGLQYGQECWMGSLLVGNDSIVGNVRAAEADCKSTCVGARGELCGGASRMSLWIRNVTVG
ncbi:WSC-domain-containing protein [Corynespora cassiicola Philippines]|uniref:WSC-domain-containing protein n=1 Tax=Corynespora cassiicola Philippines TaxID=1448308 RepID=A0A2T2N7G0_CORCC|nr:WSC-domain-containing protein [Corynespora cassiicola Philippines]